MMTNFKEEYGEVETPLFFIEKMFEMIPDKLFKMVGYWVWKWSIFDVFI